MKPWLTDKGFTLLEVMVAVVIFAFIAFATTEAVRRNRDSKERIDEEIDTYQAIRGGFAILHRDFSNIFHLNQIDFTPFSGAPDKAATIDPNLYKILRPRFVGTESGVHFVALTHVRMNENSHESELEEISFTIEKDKTDPTVLHLYKRTTPILDEYPEEGGQSYLVLEDLADFKIRYFDSVKDQWASTWDNQKETNEDEIPDLIEIHIIVNLRHPTRADSVKKIDMLQVFHPLFNNSYKKTRMGALPSLEKTLSPARSTPVER